MKNAEFYLKRMAALQFKGSKDNLGYITPMHVLEQPNGETHAIDMDDARELIINDERIQVYYEVTGATYDSLEDLIRNESDEINIEAGETLDEYNARVENEGYLYLPIISLEKALDDEYIRPNCDEKIWSLYDYISAYGIDADSCSFFSYDSGWELKALSFTRKGCMEAAEHLSNHIFGKAHHDVMNAGNEEFSCIMGYLMEQGNALLAKDSESLKVTRIHEVETDIEERCREQVGKNATLVCGCVGVTDEKDGSYVEMAFTVRRPKAYTENGPVYWDVEVLVSIPSKGDYAIEYPFEDDRCYQKMRSDEGVVQLYNYVKYRYDFS